MTRLPDKLMDLAEDHGLLIGLILIGMMLVIGIAISLVIWYVGTLFVIWVWENIFGWELQRELLYTLSAIGWLVVMSIGLDIRSVKE